MDIAKCVRIFEPEPDDDLVNKRETAINKLRANFTKKKDICSLMRKGSVVCEVFRNTPKIPEEIAVQIETVIKKNSPSFIRDDRDLEMSVCFAAAAVNLMEQGTAARNGKVLCDILAVAIWSGASFLPTCKATKLEEFRKLVIGSAKSRIIKSSLETRIRQPVTELEFFENEEPDFEEFKREIASSIDALKINAELDREELNLLWWVLGGTSEIFGQPLKSLSPELRVVTSGIEFGALMRRLPTQSHRNLALHGLEKIAPLSLATLLEKLGENRLTIANSFKEELLIDNAPLVFPLLSAIRLGEVTEESFADLERPISEWGARALLERAILQIKLI